MKSDREQYWNPYLGGALLGLVLFASFFVAGHGLGASGGVNRIVVAVEDVVVPEHVDKTPYLAQWLAATGTRLQHWIVWEVAGILLGGFVSACCAAGSLADLPRPADHARARAGAMPLSAAC